MFNTTTAFINSNAPSSTVACIWSNPELVISLSGGGIVDLDCGCDACIEQIFTPAAEEQQYWVEEIRRIAGNSEPLDTFWMREEPIAEGKHFVRSETRMEPLEKGLTSDGSNLPPTSEVMTLPLAVDCLDLERLLSVTGVWPSWVEGQMYSPPKDERYVAPCRYDGWKELDELVEWLGIKPVHSTHEEGLFGAESYHDKSTNASRGWADNAIRFHGGNFTV